MVNKRTATRILAIQLLYSYLCSATNDDVDSVIAAQAEEELVLDKYDQDLLHSLVDKTKEHKDHFDTIINQHKSEDWTMERMDQVILILLKVAICEFIYSPSSPKKVIIDEYTTITSCFTGSKEVNFVNAILEKISGEIRSEEQ